MIFRSLMLAALMAGALQAKAGILARFGFQFGTVDVELFDRDKPITVENFLRYQSSGYWNRTIMHRWLPDFIVQGGVLWDSPIGSLTIPSLPPIPSEYNVGPRLPNIYGTIAMALAQDQPNSATASWFFNVTDNSAGLDPQQFTVFGRLLRGTNILNRFKLPSGVVTNGLYNTANEDGSPNEFPVYVTNNVPDYVLVDVRILFAQITRVSGGLEIAWPSVEGRPNIIDYSTNAATNWRPISTNTGTGLRMAITNNPGSDSFRAYRVRIDYAN